MFAIVYIAPVHIRKMTDKQGVLLMYHSCQIYQQ